MNFFESQRISYKSTGCRWQQLREPANVKGIGQLPVKELQYFERNMPDNRKKSSFLNSSLLLLRTDIISDFVSKLLWFAGRLFVPVIVFGGLLFFFGPRNQQEQLLEFSLMHSVYRFVVVVFWETLLICDSFGSTGGCLRSLWKILPCRNRWRHKLTGEFLCVATSV